MIDGEGFRAGDPACFEAVVRRHASLVMGVVDSYAQDPDHREDLFQEVWQRVYRKRDTYSGRGSFEAWLHRLATNTCRSEYRARRVRAETLRRYEMHGTGEETGWRPMDPLAGTERREFHARLHQALAQLTEREHEAVVLRILEERPPAEVAEIMGIEGATVRSLIRNAVQRLRTIMEDSGEELSRHRAAP